VRRGPLLALAVAIVVVVAVVVLFRVAGRKGAEPELPDTWRPYG
jgi:hypothetical protein